MQCVSQDQGPGGEEAVHGRRGVVVGAGDRRPRQLQRRRKQQQTAVIVGWLSLIDLWLHAGLLQLAQGRRGPDGGAAAEVDPVVLQEEEWLLGVPRVHGGGGGLSAGGRLRRLHEHGHQEEARHHPQESLVRTPSISNSQSS